MSGDDSKKKDPKTKEPTAPSSEAPSDADLSKATKIAVTSRGERALVRRWRFTKTPTELLVSELDEGDKAALIGSHPDPSVIVRKVG